MEVHTTYDINTFKAIMFNVYSPDDFRIGMLIIAKKSDKVYGITEGEVYEINSINESEASSYFGIGYIGDNGQAISKAINHKEYPFDAYFEIAK
jgi:hypothetical protein